jgi:transposase-like protein
LRVPRDRSGEFSTALFERYARSEKALAALDDRILAIIIAASWAAQHHAR